LGGTKLDWVGRDVDDEEEARAADLQKFIDPESGLALIKPRAVTPASDR
jgi:hypothetical protein